MVSPTNFVLITMLATVVKSSIREYVDVYVNRSLSLLILPKDQLLGDRFR